MHHVLRPTIAAAMAALLLVAPSLAAAQSSSDAATNAANADLAPIGTIDPNNVTPPPPGSVPVPQTTPVPAPVAPPGSPAPVGNPTTAAANGAAKATTFSQNDVVAQAENVFGRGAEGLAKLVERIFADNGEPNAYIVGREASAAIGVGLRYGSGTLFHRVEGQRPVYWTGPSVGFDLGADASKSFVLVYNLVDSQDLFKRFPAVEGKVYFVGGFTANYLRRGDIVLVPIKLGVGWRLGANVGYLKLSEKSKILPF